MEISIATGGPSRCERRDGGATSTVVKRRGEVQNESNHFRSIMGTKANDLYEILKT